MLHVLMEHKHKSTRFSLPADASFRHSLFSLKVLPLILVLATLPDCIHGNDALHSHVTEEAHLCNGS